MPTLLKMIKKDKIIKAMGNAIITKKKATLLKIALNFEKTSVGLGNFYARN